MHTYHISGTCTVCINQIPCILQYVSKTNVYLSEKERQSVLKLIGRAQTWSVVQHSSQNTFQHRDCQSVNRHFGCYCFWYNCHSLRHMTVQIDVCVFFARTEKLQETVQPEMHNHLIMLMSLQTHITWFHVSALKYTFLTPKYTFLYKVHIVIMSNHFLKYNQYALIIVFVML